MDMSARRRRNVIDFAKCDRKKWQPTFFRSSPLFAIPLAKKSLSPLYGIFENRHPPFGKEGGGRTMIAPPFLHTENFSYPPNSMKNPNFLAPSALNFHIWGHLAKIPYPLF